MSGFDVIAVVVVAAIAWRFFKKKGSQHRTSEPVQPSPNKRYQPRSAEESRRSTYQTQLKSIENVSFVAQKFMNKGEFQAFRIACAAVSSVRQQHRVFAQVSLGEILKTDNKAAYRAVNSKRVDLLVIDRYGNPVLVLEVQGSGHYLDENAQTRDSIKKNSLESAGIIYEEVFTPIDEKSLQARVEQLLVPTYKDDMTAPRASLAAAAKAEQPGSQAL